MLNYIEAELGKTIKRRYFWTTMIVIYICAILGCAGFIFINHTGNNTENLALEHMIEMGRNLFKPATYLFIIFVDMITIEEFKNNTIKNIVSSGLSRMKIYLSKNIEVVVMSLAGMFLILVGSVAIGYMMLGINNTETIFMEFKQLGIQLIGTCFLWMGTASMLHFIATFIKNGTAVSLIYICLFLLLPNVLQVLGYFVNPIFNTFNRIWLGTQLSGLMVQNIPAEATIEAVAVGLGYMIFFTVLGSWMIRRADL